jgi:hypothetical protein
MLPAWQGQKLFTFNRGLFTLHQTLLCYWRVFEGLAASPEVCYRRTLPVLFTLGPGARGLDSVWLFCHRCICLPPPHPDQIGQGL